MKSLILLFAFLSVVAFQVIDKKTAILDLQYQGKDVYLLCKPTKDFEYVEVGKAKIFVIYDREITDYYKPQIDWAIKNSINFDGIYHNGKGVMFIKYN